MAKKDFAISLRLHSQQFKSGIQAVQQQLNSFKSFATKAFVGLGVAEFGKKLIKAASNLETLDTNLGTLLGSMDKGVKLRKELQKYGQSTPYDTDGLVRATQTMLGYGVAQQKVMPIMRQLGDVAMGDANKLQSLALAYSQMTAAGKVMKQDMNQMANAGFGFNQVAQSMGISVGELTDRISKGKVHVNDIEKALKDATSEGGLFFNSAINGSSTFEGVVSNLEESVTSTLANIGQEILPTAKEVATGISSLIDSMSGTIQSVAKTIGNLFSFIISNARSVGVAIASIFLTPKIVGAITGIVNYWKTAQNQIVANALASTSQINRLQKQVTSLESEESELRTQVEQAEANQKLAIQVQYNAKVRELSTARTNLEKAQSQQRINLEKAEAIQVGSLKGVFATLGTVIKSALSTTVFTAAIAAVATLVDKVVQLIQKTREVNNQVSDYKKRIESVQYDESVSRLTDIYNRIKDSKNQTAEIKKYQNELNSKYGISITQANGKLKTEKDITAEIQKQIKLLKNRAEMNVLSDELENVYRKRRKIQEKYGTTDPDKIVESTYHPKGIFDFSNPIRGNEIVNDANEIRNGNQIEKDITNRLAKLGRVDIETNSGGGSTTNTVTTNTDTGSTTTKKTGTTKSNPIADANADYAKAIRVAESKFDLGLITQQEKDDEIIQAKEALINAYLENGKTISSDNQFVKDINEAAKKKANEEFDKKIQEGNPYSSENVANRKFDESFNVSTGTPTNEEQLSKVNDRIQEEIQYYHELQKAAKEATNEDQIKAVNDALDEVSANLGTLKNKATSLNDTIKAADLKKQVDDLNKEISENYPILGKSGGYLTEIQNTYSNLVGLAQDWQNVSNAEGFEKVLAIFDAIFGTLEKIQSIFEGWKNLSDMFDKLSGLSNGGGSSASNAVQGVASIGTPEAVSTVADDGTEKAIEQQTALQDAVQQTSTIKQAAAAADTAAQATTVAASQGTVAANTAEMTTSMTAAGGEASKQAAKLPFPANIIAIASIVSMIVGLIATLKGAFASGGIIQGAHKHGDMQLARVNAGEMILNSNQQKHLFNALNSASLATPLTSNGGNVTFRLRGQDLIGSINNYKSKMGKSTI